MDARSAIADTMLMAMSTAIHAVPRRSSRRLSDFSDIAHLTVSFNGISLTPRQHKLIKNGYERWRRESEQTAGEWTLDYVARRDSQLRLDFERHRELAKIHAAAITDVLDMAVESVEALDDSLGPLLVSYSSQNGVLEEKECFDRNYWSRVSEALCQLARQFPIKTHKWDTVAAWRIVILFIVNKIDYGFQLEKNGAPSLTQQHSFDNPAYKG
ncbi:unnamed protein product, partial [Mesorhabditis belari]|uniref:Uncharacterized protein n=1 Tax=Mesorhabditis belari TaxID=2138241 RepID=A0AAF3EUK2_9BILA